MSQTFHVLKCHLCEIFQVDIVKKSKKWQCKICNNKQSLKQIYGVGTSKECRFHTQKLNELKLRKNNDVDNIDLLMIKDAPPIDSERKSTSKWSAFIDDDKTDECIKSKAELEYVLEIPKTNKRKSNFPCKSVDHCPNVTESVYIKQLEFNLMNFDDNSNQNSSSDVIKSNLANTESKWFKYVDETDSNISDESLQDDCDDIVKKSTVSDVPSSSNILFTNPETDENFLH